MQIDCVASGQEAIDAIRRELPRYSAVFMDHMMPEMDGIEATRLIREIGTDYAKNVPIIACTANAITGNEQMFIGMGFQAFLSKPIDINRLDDILRRWVQTGSPNKANTKQANTAQGGRENESLRAALENAFIPGLDIPGGLKRFGGDETSYMNVLRSYANHTGASLDQIKTVDRHNLAEYAIIVHGIKGASRGICAETAGALAEHLEKAAKLGDLDFVTGHHNDLLEQVHQLIAHIRDLIERLDPDEPKPKKDMLDREALLKLMQACDTYDMDSVDAIMKEIMAYDYETDSVLAGWLKDSIAGLQFSHVVQRIADILGSGQEMQDES
jgi:CheY-like chemotaxis protein